jgi:hypothetical protein
LALDARDARRLLPALAVRAGDAAQRAGSRRRDRWAGTRGAEETDRALWANSFVFPFRLQRPTRLSTSWGGRGRLLGRLFAFGHGTDAIAGTTGHEDIGVLGGILRFYHRNAA